MKIKQTKSIGIALAMAVVVGGITPGVYADTTTNKTEVERIGGADRTETSLKVLEKLGGVKKTYLVNGYQFSDALSIAPVAAANNEGIVLATKGSLDASLSKQGINEVTLVGGENSISSSVEKSLASKFKTKRIAGTDRYKTSEMIVESTGKKEVGVATGKDFPDALSSGAFLAKKNLPLLLVNGKTQTSLPQGLKGLYTFGGKSSVANDFGKRIAGANRYETSEKIAEEFGKSDVVVLASGTNFADALAAAPLAKKMNAPIVLVKKDSLSENAKKLVKEAKKVYVIGGENTISNKLVDEIKGKKINENSNSNSSNSNSNSGSNSSQKPSVSEPVVDSVNVSFSNPENGSYKSGDTVTATATINGKNLTKSFADSLNLAITPAGKVELKYNKTVDVTGNKITISQKFVVKDLSEATDISASLTAKGKSGNDKTKVQPKVVVKEVKISGAGVTVSNGVYQARVEAGKILNLSTEVLNDKSQKLTGADGEVITKIIGKYDTAIEIEKDTNPIKIAPDEDVENNSQVKLEVTSKKDLSVKAEVTVTVYQLKKPDVSINGYGYLGVSDKDWFQAVENGKATVTRTNSSGTTITLTQDQNALSNANTDNIYLAYKDMFGTKDIRFGVKKPANKGEVYRIKVDGYKTVKLISTTDSSTPKFNKFDLE
ncbi:cell wall-binding repeat-containing protein [Peptostreptococcus stomatis]|uniref:cell wall-binding repeat-containing protein n=1 Tax=Peptostreptococcus stomatis TaxID=341694 RepID=UPI0028CFF6F8|nr:cell wall-binding repeat-containing protein [Peptostreptococcus stomatis]